MGPWPAVARKRLNPARGPRGPRGRGIAVGLLSSPKERGATAPAADLPTRYHQKVPRFTMYFAVPIFPHFRILWLKMGQHGPT